MKKIFLDFFCPLCFNSGTVRFLFFLCMYVRINSHHRYDDCFDDINVFLLVNNREKVSELPSAR